MHLEKSSKKPLWYDGYLTISLCSHVPDSMLTQMVFWECLRTHLVRGPISVAYTPITGDLKLPTCCL